MSSFVIIALFTGLAIGISFFLNFFFAIFKILFTKPIPPKGAVEIDKKEHIFAHPDYTTKLKEFKSIGVQSLYDVLERGLRAGGDRPQFSFRNSSEEKFKSLSYK